MSLGIFASHGMAAFRPSCCGICLRTTSFCPVQFGSAQCHLGAYPKRNPATWWFSWILDFHIHCLAVLFRRACHHFAIHGHRQTALAVRGEEVPGGEQGEGVTAKGRHAPVTSVEPMRGREQSWVFLAMLALFCGGFLRFLFLGLGCYVVLKLS